MLFPFPAHTQPAFHATIDRGCCCEDLTMFMDELTPVVKQLTGYPVAFLGGFFSGLLRLNLSDDPVKQWLDQQSGSYTATSSSNGSNGSKNSGPQSISIE